uniref:Uncharacterized protein n=1 Tax=Hemiselmis andersenii TaxID=464988 RepID=A0A6T8NQ85_HEMAN
MDDDMWQSDHQHLPSSFGELRALTQHSVNEIRVAQAKLFDDHMFLESQQTGQDFDFLEAFEDTFQGEDSSEARFKPLAQWFEAKQQVVERLTEHLGLATDAMLTANEEASRHIASKGDS